MENIKSCQQYLLFYHFSNKMFLKMVPKLLDLLSFPFKVEDNRK